MNDTPRAKPKRASRRAIRMWGWTAGVLSFLSPFVLFGLSPKPVQASTSGTQAGGAPTQRPHRPVVLVVTKKIIYTQAPTTSVTTSGSGPITYVQAAAAPAVAATCGTHPC